MCLNDQMDHSLESAEVAETDVKENFYEKMFPKVSNFEIEPKSEGFRRSIVPRGYYTSLTIYLFGTSAFLLLLLKPVLKKVVDISISRPLLTK